MRVFAHRLHIYEDRAHHSYLQIPAGGWKEVDDELAKRLLAAHPGKLCDVTIETEPNNHVCPVNAIINAERQQMENRMMTEPVLSTVPTTRLSGQKRKLLRQAKARSRIARMEK